jgi:hypothetical protein
VIEAARRVHLTRWVDAVLAYRVGENVIAVWRLRAPALADAGGLSPTHA